MQYAPLLHPTKTRPGADRIGASIAYPHQCCDQLQQVLRAAMLACCHPSESVECSVGPFRGVRKPGEALRMALKAPGILIFLLSIILALAVLFTKFFGATIPMLSGEATQFYGLLAAYVVLVFGCIMRGL